MYISKNVARILVVVAFTFANITFVTAEEVGFSLNEGVEILQTLESEHGRAVQVAQTRQDYASHVQLQSAHSNLLIAVLENEEDIIKAQEDLTSSTISCVVSSENPMVACRKEMNTLSAFLDRADEVQGLHLQLHLELFLSKIMLENY